MDPDRRAALEEERAFLLRSLADLEREHAAGDVDDADFEALRDGYTVRAATALRELDAPRPAPGPDRGSERPSWPRRGLVGLLVVALIAIVWWALAASSAERLPGQQISGLDPRSERQVLLSQARSLQLEQPAAAADIYAIVLEGDPLDVEALTYRGWTLALSSLTIDDSADATERLREAVDSLALAIETDPSYPDPYCFLGIVQYRFLGAAESALPFLDGCLDAGPPADVRELVVGVRDAAAAEIDADGATGE